MNRIERLAKMDEVLQQALEAKGNERKQRFYLGVILIECHNTGEPVIEWLAKKLREQLPPTATEEYRCPACQKPFASKDALNGHGPKRCKGKSNET